MFPFKAYDPIKGKFIDIKSDNSKVSAPLEAQQALVPPSSGVPDTPARLLAFNNHARKVYDPLSPSIVHPIPAFLPLLDNRDPEVPFLTRSPTPLGSFPLDEPSLSPAGVSALPPDHHSTATPSFARPVRSVRSPLGPRFDQRHHQHFTALPTRRSSSLSPTLSSPIQRWSPGPSRFPWDRPVSPSGLSFSSEVSPPQSPAIHPSDTLLSLQSAREDSTREESTRDEPNYDSDSFELPPQVDLSTLYRIQDEELEDQSSEDEEISRPRKKPGRKVNSTFLIPAQGELAHPFEDWILDKVAMNEYMPNYAKQEGFAVNSLKERGGMIIRWPCIHGGKYRNSHNLPMEVKEKNRREEMIASGQRIRQRRGASQKQGCPFYVSFVACDASQSRYRCNGINSTHTCARDPNTWDRYSRYRNQDPVIRETASDLMRHGNRPANISSYINDKYKGRIRGKDLNRITQTEREARKSLSDAGVSTSESQRLLDAIARAGDRYRVKYKEGTQIMDCIFYWDPSDVQLAQHFSQVIQIDTTFKDNTSKYPLLEITATTNEMNTILIAQALISSESAENFLWVLQQLDNCILRLDDGTRFSPRVILTDAAKGFVKALNTMKANGIWLHVRHLLCRWHVYEAIKRYIIPLFKHVYTQGKQQEQINSFINAFKDVVCAPTEVQMRALWRSLIEEGGWPAAAIAYVKKEYYESSKARKVMQCFIKDCGNLCQTTTSRNEGSHSAFRSNAGIIRKPAESYELRRRHKNQWLRELRAKAMNACNRIPLDIRAIKELSLLIGYVSLFALTEIKRQILIAKKEVADGGEYIARVQACRCDAHSRYGLPCLHMVPIDGTPIPLESVTQFWKLENWNQEFIPTLDTSIRPSRPANNISIIDITHASQSNDGISYSEHLNSHLNNAALDSQRINLEQQLNRLLETFDQAPEHLRSDTLRNIELQLVQLDKLTRIHVQDPPELTSRRTFGKGDPRRLTAAENAEQQLRRQDKTPRQQPAQSHTSTVDLTSPHRPLTLSQRPGESQHSTVPLQCRTGPVITTFSRTGVVVRSSIAQASKSTISMTQTTEPDIVILQSWTDGQEDAAGCNQDQTRHSNKQTSSAFSQPSSQTSSRPQRKRNLPARFLGYTGTLIQPPRKHAKR